MFENDIEILKAELDRMVQKYNVLETELVLNNKEKRIVDRLKELIEEIEDKKFTLVDTCLVCGTALLVVSVLLLLMDPISLKVFLAVFACSGLTSGIFILDSLLNLLRAKSEYKKLAVEENLELVDNINDIRTRGLELNQQCNYLEEMISDYSELVGYLSDYNEMIANLERIKKEKSEELNKMMNEYLEENVDYSKVHLREYEIPEKIYLKKLTNIVK